MKDITVNVLFKELKAQIAKGNGNKVVFLSSDDEGNDFHQAFYAITDDYESIEQIHDSTYFNTNGYSLEDIVILG